VSLGVGFGGPAPAGLLPSRSTKPAIPSALYLESLPTRRLTHFNLAIPLSFHIEGWA